MSGCDMAEIIAVMSLTHISLWLPRMAPLRRYRRLCFSPSDICSHASPHHNMCACQVWPLQARMGASALHHERTACWHHTKHSI